MLLSRQIEASDIHQEVAIVARRSIPWHPITEGETFRAACQVTSSSPEEDEITAPILRLSWPIMGRRIANLFNKCAHLGVHPRAFKAAEVVILPVRKRKHIVSWSRIFRFEFDVPDKDGLVAKGETCHQKAVYESIVSHEEGVAVSITVKPR
ncbi:hypothetical protein K3495_g15992 [Podosphaera aphanis]|nr:hypothetical protein K3495_g15992 [Podosphaera aphanis]